MTLKAATNIKKNEYNKYLIIQLMHLLNKLYTFFKNTLKV